MGKKARRLLLEQATVIRVLCLNVWCGGAVEIPLDAVERAFKERSCPLCGWIPDEPASGIDSPHPVRQLAAAIRKFREEAATTCSVELLLPDETE